MEKYSHTTVTANSLNLDHEGVGQSYSIVLFDGECNLCNASVNFIIARDDQRGSVSPRFNPRSVADCWSNMAYPAASWARWYWSRGNRRLPIYGGAADCPPIAVALAFSVHTDRYSTVCARFLYALIARNRY